MMNTERETAERFGILERIEKLRADLLLCKFVEKVEFDLSGFYDNLNQVIVLTKYDIAPGADYFMDRYDTIDAVIRTAEQHGLSRTEDLIEDHGTWFYFVFRISDKETFYSK